MVALVDELLELLERQVRVLREQGLVLAARLRLRRGNLVAVHDAAVIARHLHAVIQIVHTGIAVQARAELPVAHAARGGSVPPSILRLMRPTRASLRGAA